MVHKITKICLALLGLIMMNLFTFLGLTGTGGTNKVGENLQSKDVLRTYCMPDIAHGNIDMNKVQGAPLMCQAMREQTDTQIGLK